MRKKFPERNGWSGNTMSENKIGSQTNKLKLN